MITQAINKAKQLLNDNNTKILKYAETKDYFLFSYGTQDGKTIFDNTMIRVDKKDNKAYFTPITKYLDQINKLNFKDAKI